MSTHEAAAVQPVADERVYHLRAYGDVTKGEFDYYVEHHTLVGYRRLQGTEAPVADEPVDEVDQSVAEDLHREFGLTYSILSKATLGSMLVDALRLSCSIVEARGARPQGTEEQGRAGGGALTDAEIISLAYDCNAMPEKCTDKTLILFARALLASTASGPSAGSMRADGDALSLAIRFHEAYERLAPSFGYETRSDTKVFDPESKNGRLMVAVCAELTSAASQSAAEALRPDEQHPSAGTEGKT